jgi:LmbE family N-acetylglucosaminyl deacetylase
VSQNGGAANPGRSRLSGGALLVLILSPHLDDAALSCPAYLQRLANDGIATMVATVFTDGVSALYQKRRAEDLKALRELGASARHLGLPDAPFRSPKYRDFYGIVFGRAREYRTTRRVVARHIGELIRELRPRQVLAPMAVGNHVDHRIVRDAALLAVPLKDLLFYEDRPYAFVRGQVAQVIGKSTRPLSEQFWRRYFAATYVRRYRESATTSRIVKGWDSVAAFPREYWLMKAIQIDPRPSELARTLTALACYRSQLRDLFANDSEIKRLYETVPEKLYRIR